MDVIILFRLGHLLIVLGSHVATSTGEETIDESSESINSSLKMNIENASVTLSAIPTSSTFDNIIDIETTWNNESHTNASHENASSVTTSTPVQLNVCFMVEQALWYSFDRSAGAVDLAIEYANEQILQQIGLTLVPIFTDIGTTCQKRNHGVPFAMDLRDRGIHCHVYIGAGCAYDFQDLYDVADFLEIPIIGCPAAGVGGDADVSAYVNMARLSVTHTNTVKVIISFLHKNNYTTPVILQDQDVSFNQQISLIAEATFKSHDHEDFLISSSKFRQIHSARLTNENITTLLKEEIVGSRVFILLTNASTTRRIMLAAHDLALTRGDYVFIAVELFLSPIWGFFNWKNNDTFDQAAKEAYQTLLLVALAPSSDSAFEAFEQKVKAVSPFHKSHSYTYGPNEHVDLVTSHFYDSVVFYASVMRDIFLNGSDIFAINNFIYLVNSLENYSFESPIHGTVTLDENGDRISSYVIKSLNLENGIFEPTYVVSPKNSGLTMLGPLKWPHRSDLPPNSPRCGFDGRNPICSSKPLSKGSIAAAVVVPVVLFLLGMIRSYVVIRRKIESNRDPFWWRVFTQELNLSINSSVIQSQKDQIGVSGAEKKILGNRYQSKHKVDDDDHFSTVGNEADYEKPKLSFVLYGKIAYFRNNIVALRELPKPLQHVSAATQLELTVLRTVKHYYLQEFYGIAINEKNLCEFFIGEVCQKGSLMALLEETTLTMDWDFKYSLMKGITMGMAYLHTTKVISHGDLSAHTVLIDSRFVTKITDYSLYDFRPLEDLMPPNEDDEDCRDFSRLLWRAPEFLRVPALGGSQKGDVYSFGIIMQQIILRSAPYETSVESLRSDYFSYAKDLIIEIKRGSNPPQRPLVPLSSCSGPIHQLMVTCWDEHPETRITFAKIRELLIKAVGTEGDNIIEHLIRRLDQYAVHLEHEMEDKTKMFIAEQEHSEELLKAILPKCISDKLRRGEMIYPEVYESATVQFSDINGFAGLLASAPTPFVTIEIINALFTLFDQVIGSFDVYKVENFDDNYLLVSGLPERNGIRHAGEMARLALVLRKDVGELNFPSHPYAKLQLRVGISSGSCVASVIGLKIPKYTLFGDTINVAWRMMTYGEPSKIQLSQKMKDLLDESMEFLMQPRGEIEIQEKKRTETIETYWLLSGRVSF